MKWYKRDPDKARLAWLQHKYGPNCCGEFPQYAHVRHFVYLVAGHEEGLTKIGLCIDLARRVSALQTACPFKIDLVWSASVPSREIAREMEAAVFQNFRRLNGEWLAAEPSSIVKFLEA